MKQKKAKATKRKPFNEILDLKTLTAKRWAIKMPSEKALKLELIRVLWDLVQKEGVKSDRAAYKRIIEVTSGISDVTLRRYKSSGFKNVVDSKLKDKGFLISVINKSSKKVIHTFACTVGKLIEFNLGNVPGAVTPLLDQNKVLAIRNQDLLDQEGEEVSFDKIHEKARDIATKYAGGLFNIKEACTLCNVRYLDWLRWCISDEYVRQLYKEAHFSALFLNQSRQLTLIDNHLIILLQRGYTETVSTVYEKITTPAAPEGIMVPKAEKRIRKDLALTDLARAKAIILHQNDIDDAGGSDDKFEKMSLEELDSWLKNNDVKLRKVAKGRKDLDDDPEEK